MTASSVRLAIVGAGHMGARHAACIRATQEARLTAVYSPNLEHARALAAGYEAQVCAGVEELAGRQDVDAVVVAAPTSSHADLALAAIRAGKHVIVEKPLARTMDEAQMLMRTAEGAGVLLLTGHVARFYPALRLLHEQITLGRVGAPAVIHLSRETATPAVGWRSDLAKSGGVILDLGIHEFDWLLWTIGPVERVYCKAVVRSGGDAHEYAITTLRLASGAIAQVESSMVRASGFRTAGEIAGDKGMLTFDSDLDQALRSDLEAQGRSVQDGLPTTFTDRSPYVTQMEHWVRCIQGRDPPEVTPKQACDALQVALAALESAATGRAVTL
jgi:predicted dehydrogenase